MRKLLIVATLFVALAACQSSGARRTITIATDFGREHAKQLIKVQPDTLKMQYVLLDVRSHEEKLRREGHNEAADAYVESFEGYLRDNSPELAKEIL